MHVTGAHITSMSLDHVLAQADTGIEVRWNAKICVNTLAI